MAFLRIKRIVYNKVLKKFIWEPIYLRYLLKHRGEYFKIFTHLTKVEKLLLYKLALSLKDNSTIVEIGSYLGASSLFLASAIKEQGGQVYCVDTWMNEGMSEGEKDTFAEFSKNIAPLKDYIHVLRGESADIAKTFNEEIDLLFVDGEHSYEAVKTDVELWLPKVKNGGIVIFHDIGWAEGVIKVVNEFIKPIQIEGHTVDNTYWARIRRNE